MSRPRVHTVSGFERGEEPNGWNMWCVVRVMEVRRVEGRTRSGGAGRLQVKIRWVGSWRDKWSKTHETVKVKGRTRRKPLFNRATMEEARRMEEVKNGARAPRKAIEAHAEPPGRKRWRKWTKALRSAIDEGAKGEAPQIHQINVIIAHILGNTQVP